MKKKIWIIDIIALVAFLVLFKPQLTGFSLHEWLGLAIGIVLLVHLLQHWNWVKAIARCLARVKAKQRIRFSVDAAIAAGFFTIIFTGLVISSILNLDLRNYPAWRDVHNVASYATLGLLALKLALHWSLLKNTLGKAFRPAEKQQALTPMGISRRKFLKASGFAAAGFLIGMSGLAVLLKNTEAAPQQESTPSPTQADQPAVDAGDPVNSSPPKHPNRSSQPDCHAPADPHRGRSNRPGIMQQSLCLPRAMQVVCG